MAQRRGRLILVGAAILVALSMWRTLSVEREKRRVATAYEDVQRLLQETQAERDALGEELSAARKTVDGQADDLAAVRQELEDLRGELGRRVEELAAMQQAQTHLAADNAELTARLESLRSEKERLEASFNSLDELRLAIRRVKDQLRAERWAGWGQRWAERRAQLEAFDQGQLARGNRGLVVRGGESTLGSATKLQVHVLEPQPQ